MHIGNAGCTEKDLKNYITKIKNDDKGFIIGMGDYADCIIKDDKRFQSGGLAKWVEKDNIIQSQLDYVTDLFTPVKDKIICLLTGNHEEQIHDKYQNNFTVNLCRNLGVPYAGYTCFIELKFTRGTPLNVIKVHAWHGSGAAQTEGARLMRLMRLVNDIEARIYLMGHLHAITYHTPDRLICSNGRVRSERLAAVTTGSWLRTYTQTKTAEPVPPSYGEKAGYKPSRLGCPVIHICPDKDIVTVEA